MDVTCGEQRTRTHFLLGSSMSFFPFHTFSQERSFANLFPRALELIIMANRGIWQYVRGNGPCKKPICTEGLYAIPRF